MVRCKNCPNFKKIGIDGLYKYKKFIKWYDKILLLKKYYNFLLLMILHGIVYLPF